MRDKRMDSRATAPHEMILIRVGHHLWRSRKRQEWPLEVVDLAPETVWRLKEEVRIPLREKHLAFVEERAKKAHSMRPPKSERLKYLRHGGV